MPSAHPTADASSSTSRSLLRRVQQHDAEAWRRLTVLYGPLVYEWACRAGLQESDAADVGQEVFQVVAQRVASFDRDAEGASFRGWLWGITRNKLREFARLRAGQPSPQGGTEAAQRLAEIADELPSGSEGRDAPGAQAALMRRALELIRGDFDQHTWQAFWRTAVDEQPAVAVADELGMTAGAVRQARFRVLRRLRQELDELL